MQVIIQSVSDILWFKGIKTQIDFLSNMQNNSLQLKNHAKECFFSLVGQEARTWKVPNCNPFLRADFST